MSALVVIALLPFGNADASPEALFREAVARQQAGEKARAAFEAAIAAYRARRDEGVRHPDLDRTIGSAYLLMGDVPEAIAWYRRGLRLAPHDAALHEALSLARERVARPAGRTFGLPPAVLPSPRPWLFLGAALAWLVACIALTRWYLRRGGWPWLAVSLGVLALGLAIAWVLQPAEPSPIAVLRRDEVLLRRGDGLRFAPRYDVPLPAGTEVETLAQRGDWWLVRLSGGERGWIAEADLILVPDE
jgi:tetratricopeptide (TPR) repeat protein